MQSIIASHHFSYFRPALTARAVLLSKVDAAQIEPGAFPWFSTISLACVLFP